MISNHPLFLQLIGQYPPPPPVATGPGLDRPLYIPTPDYTGEGYTMNRTRMFYQDHLEPAEVSGPTAFIFPDGSSRGHERRISGENRPQPVYANNLESPRDQARW